ncbi:MAG: DUF1318 domain-containing protein [Phycisphaeraceae bacterium]|nr:DUF1318 domain-containing protein [Phycisphaeraceae bacterium]
MRKHVAIPLAAALLPALLLSLAAFARAASCDDVSYDQLKARFQQRYAALSSLKQQGKAGETSEGWVEAVKDEYQSARADSQRDVRQFLQEENDDRKLLYCKIAKDQGATESAVAQRNARRNFDNAGPDEYLKGSDGKWVKKKDRSGK